MMPSTRVCAGLLLFWLSRPACSAPPEITATFSIVAVDPENGVCGAAVASRYPAVGKVVPYVRADVGAFCTQHYHVPKWGEPALDLLQGGKRPEAVLAELLRDDPDADLRQLAIVDMRGRVAVHNPTAATGSSLYWGAMSGRFYSCQGNTLVGRGVIAAMAAAYEETEGSLADRLMAALIAGDCAGGDHRGRLAAGIRVARHGTEGHWLSLDVDESDDAVLELAQRYAELEHEAKGAWRGGKLPFQHPCADLPDAEGSVSLFDGQTLRGWTQRGGQAKYSVADGCIVGEAVPNTPNSFLCTQRQFGNFLLELEFLVHPTLNSGVQIRSHANPKVTRYTVKEGDTEKMLEVPAGIVHGYQVEIDPSERAWTAGIYDESRRGWLNDLRQNEPARKAFRQGQWNHLRIECRGASIKTWLNGVAAADLNDDLTSSGFIGLQVHGIADNEPRTVRWRNIRIQELPDPQ